MVNKIYIEPKASERDYQRLEALGQKLGVILPRTFLEMQVTMPNGEVTHHHKQRVHSWMRNGYNQMICQIGAMLGDDALFGAGKLNYARWDGAVINSGAYLGTSSWEAWAGDITYGIIVGSSAAAFNFEGYWLTTVILNGNAGGQLAYALGTVSKAYVAGTLTLTVTHIRFMNNNSAGNVTVNEVGATEMQGIQRCGLIRDVLGAPIVIPPTGQLKVTYEISLVYPA